jgi:hypothetical protein
MLKTFPFKLEKKYSVLKFQVILLLDKQHEKVMPFSIQGSSGRKHLEAMWWVPEEAQLARLHWCWRFLPEVSEIQ